jgi:hypothetical protein
MTKNLQIHFLFQFLIFNFSFWQNFISKENTCWQSSTRGISQIWLQVRNEIKKNKKYYFILATCWEPYCLNTTNSDPKKNPPNLVPLAHSSHKNPLYE